MFGHSLSEAPLSLTNISGITVLTLNVVHHTGPFLLGYLVLGVYQMTPDGIEGA